MPVAQQVALTTRPPTTQLNYQQMQGEIQSWNPDISPQVAGRMLNNAYRRIIDFRRWYGLMVKGQVVVPQAYTTGTVAVVTGSTAVTGIGTNWDITMVGRQWRIGFSNPTYTITTVGSATSITLDLPWGGQTLSGAGYQIFQNIVSLGPNIKRVLAMVNQKQGYKLKLHVPQEVLNIYDTWRVTTGWTYLLANYPPSSTGQPQFELYPSPTFQQAFPFLAYTQPPDMVLPADFPVLFVRSDLIVTGALADALLYRGKNSKYYDPQTAKVMRDRYVEEIQSMATNDNNLYQNDLLWEFDKYPMVGFGSNWTQSHDLDSALGNV
jgi:hypothetical protein